MKVFALIQNGARGELGALLEQEPGAVNSRDSEGATPLHRAALAGDREMALLLIDAGADVNALDSRFGATPAGWAIEHLRGRGGLLAIEIDDAKLAIQRADTAWLGRLLERFPALKTARAEDGRELAEIARGMGDPELARLFD